MMVGTYQVPCSFISFMSSSFMKVPCSIESTPPMTARRIAFGAMRVRGDGEAVIVRGGDDGLDLGYGQLRIVRAAAFVEHAAGGHDLDQVGAVLVMLAHGFPGVVRTH